MSHMHRCGADDFHTDDHDPALGCGHKWSHERPVGGTEVEFDASHMCPVCGKGPWKMKLAEGDYCPKDPFWELLQKILAEE